MAAITCDLTGLPLAVRERIRNILHREDEAKLALAKVRQAKMAAAMRTQIGPGTTKEGVGPMSLAIDGYLASWWMLKQGPTCWQDEDFVAWLKKNEESFRVPQAATRMQVGYQTTASALAIQPGRRGKLKERIVYS